MVVRKELGGIILAFAWGGLKKATKDFSHDRQFLAWIWTDLMKKVSQIH
jgi:hypothetical protein